MLYFNAAITRLLLALALAAPPLFQGLHPQMEWGESGQIPPGMETATITRGDGGASLQPTAVVYYVSSSLGDDANDGLSQATPLASVSKVNSLTLAPGDRVLFRCGDTWRADPLTLTRSGSSTSPIAFGSYPSGCTDKPTLSGAQPVSGWAFHAANIYVVDLSTGQNAGLFAYGVNQLFRGEERLPLGRWPNIDAGDGGYASIDSQPSGNNILDAALPPGDWTGAAAHIRGMRWYILNRRVTGSSSGELTFNTGAECWGGCIGWGYFLNGHLNTLDQEGEWYYEAASQRIYLYSTGGAPADGQVEGSVILKDDDRAWGGVNLGADFQQGGVAYVVVEDLALLRWFRHGIASPTNFAHGENHDLLLRNNIIQDVDGIGISLATWVFDARDGHPDGWRGGYNLTLQANTIQSANQRGIDAFARQSTFSGNLIRDVGLIENLGASGMGCPITSGGGFCTEDGDGLRIKADKPADSGNHNVVTGNRLERIAYNGMDVFGHHNTIERNVILQACYTKGDCGGVRTFGGGNLSQTPVHDLVFRENIIVDTTGNTDGCHANFRSLFGFGLYIDHYSRDVLIEANTIISSTVHGILYQDSTGEANDNTLFANSRTANWSAQVWLTGAPTSLTQHTGNVLFSLNPQSWTLSVENLGVLGQSEDNAFFSPYRTRHIRASGDRTLAEWQAYSGKDANSRQTWYTQPAGEPSRARIFYNDSSAPLTIDLGDRQYLDLEQNPVLGEIVIPPYRSRILIDNGPAVLSLSALSPSLVQAGAPSGFTLAVFGAGFNPESVVRWEGSDRLTTYISGTRLEAAISAQDVAVEGVYAVSVYDPAPPPTGTETTARYVEVVAAIWQAWLSITRVEE